MVNRRKKTIEKPLYYEKKASEQQIKHLEW